MPDRHSAGELPPGSSRLSRQIGRLHEEFLASGSHYPLSGFTELLRSLADASADPELCLNTLVRLTEASVSRASLFNDLLHYPVMADLFRAIAGTSSYLSDILVRDPPLFRWLTTTDALSHAVPAAEFRSEMDRLRDLFARPERRLESLARYHRREFLRIGSRDLLGLAGLQETAAQLSHLADATIQAGLTLAIEQMGSPPPGEFVVLGLGKLGGEELNYSSDIDLIFLYDAPGSESDPHSYFNRLGERLVQNLARPTAEGHFYRIDMRLRPESGSGPLTRSLASTLLYYESRGELWERQMLIKARPVAGEIPLGERFLGRIVPFVYPRTFLHHPAEYISRIKARIEVSVGTEENVKLMPGGIRDIEFIVQSLQLINGGAVPAIRERGTLPALALCERAGYLSAGEAARLVPAYAFLRTLEHRLQMAENAQTHTLPTDPAALDLVARKCGEPDGASLRRKLDEHRRNVRSIFERVLSVPEADTGEGIMALIDGGAGEEKIRDVLAGYGLRDTRRAMKDLRHLVTGSSLTEGRGSDARTRQAFSEAAPLLFADIARTPVPDMTLRGITTLLTSRQFPGQYYRLLLEPSFRKLVVDLCSISPRSVRGIAADPLMLEMIASDPGGLSAGADPAGECVDDPAAFKARGELRAALRHLLGFSDLDGLTGDLAAIADSVVRFHSRAAAKGRKGPDSLAVFALGKYGTREMLFDADLDLFFLAAEGAGGRETQEKRAAAILQGLTAISDRGKLYDADARLRPEGKNAPLVVTAPAYARYLKERASLWERQSLTRLRPVAGRGEWVDAAYAMVQRHVYDSPLPPGWAEQIVAMRRKMESRSRFQGPAPLDVKLGAGGMVDVEFIAQMIQLRFGRDAYELRGKKTREVLALAPPAALSPGEATELSAAYRQFREIEKLLRLTVEQHGTLLPEGETLDNLAACAGGEGGAFASSVRESMKGVRALFLDVARRIG